MNNYYLYLKKLKINMKVVYFKIYKMILLIMLMYSIIKNFQQFFSRYEEKKIFLMMEFKIIKPEDITLVMEFLKTKIKD